MDPWIDGRSSISGKNGRKMELNSIYHSVLQKAKNSNCSLPRIQFLANALECLKEMNLEKNEFLAVGLNPTVVATPIYFNPFDRTNYFLPKFMHHHLSSFHHLTNSIFF